MFGYSVGGASAMNLILVLKTFILSQLLLCYSTIDSASILFFTIPQNPSHRRSLYPLASALGSRGHNVTFFSEIIYDDGVRCNHPNVTDEFALIRHDNPAYYEVWQYKNSTSFSSQWEMHITNPLVWNAYWEMMIDVCRLTVNQKYEQLKTLAERKWDLIVIDGIMTPCGIVMIQWIKAPYIIFEPTSITGPEASHRSIPYPAATVPPIGSFFNYNHKNFFHRLHSAVSYLTEYVSAFNWDRLLQNAARPIFPDPFNMPMITRFYKNPEYSFSNLPSILDHVQPLLPDILSTGGHCKTGTPILEDQEWLTFVNDPASKGTILLSFGHMVQWKFAPARIINNIFQAFDQFPDYRVAFQYDGPPRPAQKNVKISTWLPAPGLLNHANTKLHITHGGAKSLVETICANVPMVVLPMHSEQVRNADTIERIGAGVAIDKLNLTTENIVQSIRTVLVDRSNRYSERVRKVRSFMTESIRPPLDLATFWAERVVKKGRLPENYFKHKGRQLSWIVYFNVDVVAAGFACVILGLIGLLAIARGCKKLCARK